MPAQTVSDVSTTGLFTELELLQGASLLFSALALAERDTPYTLNLEPFTSYGVPGQQAKGDGRVVMNEHTYNVWLHSDDLAATLQDVVGALQNMDTARIDGRSQAAKGRDVKVTDLGEGNYKLALVIIPTALAASDGAYGL